MQREIRLILCFFTLCWTQSMPGGPLTRVPQPVAFMQAPYDVDAARDSYYAAFGNVDYSDCVGGPGIFYTQ